MSALKDFIFKIDLQELMDKKIELLSGLTINKVGAKMNSNTFSYKVW